MKNHLTTPTILHLEKDSGGFIQSANLAGVRRYAQSLRWGVVAVAWAQPPPVKILYWKL